MDFGWLLGVVGMAILFALMGTIPLAHRSCGDCGGDCGSCDLDPVPAPPPSAGTTP